MDLWTVLVANFRCWCELTIKPCLVDLVEHHSKSFGMSECPKYCPYLIHRNRILFEIDYETFVFQKFSYFQNSHGLSLSQNYFWLMTKSLRIIVTGGNKSSTDCSWLQLIALKTYPYLDSTCIAKRKIVFNFISILDWFNAFGLVFILTLIGSL